MNKAECVDDNKSVPKESPSPSKRKTVDQKPPESPSPASRKGADQKPPESPSPSIKKAADPKPSESPLTPKSVKSDGKLPDLKVCLFPSY
jgi:hypothetical protein